MEWYNYLAAFFSGVFLSNAIPHFVSGISGDKFPTPFSSPPGKGLSSPLLNVLWAGFNIIAGFILLKISRLRQDYYLEMFTFFTGIILYAMLLSVNLNKKYKE